MQNSKFDRVLQEFNAWMNENNISFGDVFNSANQQNDSGLANSVVSGLSRHQYDQAIDIAKRLESTTATGKDFAELVDNSTSREKGDPNQVLDFNISFKNIVEEGPRSAVEQKLLDAVDTFLSPQEKKQAVDNNLNVGDVIKQVNQAMQKSQETTLQILQHNKEQEKDNKKELEEKQKVPEKKMASLGEEFGVLHEIVKNMRQPLEEGKEKSLQRESSKKNFELRVEAATLNDTGSALKSMGRDPNHVQGKGKEISK